MKASDWYILWVATGQEEALRAKAAALPKIDRVLCPKAMLWERKNGAWVQVERLLFPGYIFLKCRMDSEVYYALRDMTGVMGWLGRDTLWPSTVRQEEMDAVLAMDGGGDPRELLQDVSINKRQRRGYGVMILKGQEYKLPFNVYEVGIPEGKANPTCGSDALTASQAVRLVEKQAEEPTGDASPTDDEADQTDV